MFTLVAVFCSTAPISSAIPMNRLANTSSATGSTSAVVRFAAAMPPRVSTIPCGLRSARHPASTTMV